MLPFWWITNKERLRLARPPPPPLPPLCANRLLGRSEAEYGSSAHLCLQYTCCCRTGNRSGGRRLAHAIYQFDDTATAPHRIALRLWLNSSPPSPLATLWCILSSRPSRRHHGKHLSLRGRLPSRHQAALRPSVRHRPPSYNSISHL